MECNNAVAAVLVDRVCLAREKRFGLYVLLLPQKNANIHKNNSGDPTQPRHNIVSRHNRFLASLLSCPDCVDVVVVAKRDEQKSEFQNNSNGFSKTLTTLNFKIVGAAFPREHQQTTIRPLLGR